MRRQGIFLPRGYLSYCRTPLPLKIEEILAVDAWKYLLFSHPAGCTSSPACALCVAADEAKILCKMCPHVIGTALLSLVFPSPTLKLETCTQTLNLLPLPLLPAAHRHQTDAEGRTTRVARHPCVSQRDKDTSTRAARRTHPPDRTRHTTAPHSTESAEAQRLQVLKSGENARGGHSRLRTSFPGEVRACVCVEVERACAVQRQVRRGKRACGIVL